MPLYKQHGKITKIFCYKLIFMLHFSIILKPITNFEFYRVAFIQIFLSIWHQMLSSSRTSMSFLSKGLSLLMASENGTYTTSLFLTPTIMFLCPCMMASMAPTPVLLARILSRADGLPPRCKCPSIDTRTS